MSEEPKLRPEHEQHHEVSVVVEQSSGVQIASPPTSPTVAAKGKVPFIQPIFAWKLLRNSQDLTSVSTVNTLSNTSILIYLYKLCISPRLNNDGSVNVTSMVLSRLSFAFCVLVIILSLIKKYVDDQIPTLLQMRAECNTQLVIQENKINNSNSSPEEIYDASEEIKRLKEYKNYIERKRGKARNCKLNFAFIGPFSLTLAICVTIFSIVLEATG